MERSDRHQPSVRLRPPASPPHAGKRSPMGEIATPKLTTWIIFLNWLETNLGWLKSGMKSMGCEAGWAQTPPSAAGPPGPTCVLPLATAGSKTGCSMMRRPSSGWVHMPGVLHPPRPAAAGSGTWCPSPTRSPPLGKGSSTSSARLTASAGGDAQAEISRIISQSPLGLPLRAAEDALNELFRFPSGQRCSRRAAIPSPAPPLARAPSSTLFLRTGLHFLAIIFHPHELN